MTLFQLLGMYDTSISPHKSKLHIATHSGGGGSNPLDEFFAGKFERWQSWQNKKNFERPFIIALIKLPGRHRWLFAGAFKRLGRRRLTTPPAHWHYETQALEGLQELVGRLVLRFRRSGRASYLNAERWAKQIEVDSLRAKPMTVGEFPGYHRVCVPWSRLKVVVSEGESSWRAALKNVSGVYVITNTDNGKAYVGSATGGDGIWGRWCSYAKSGHGGNKDLRRLLKEEGSDYASHFTFAILETGDTHASEKQVQAREMHWQRVLATREHGYN